LRIAIFCRSLTGVLGGMEKQLLGIAKGFLEEGHEVYVITLDNGKIKPFFEFDPRLKFLSINIGNSLIKASLTQRVKRQKRVFHLLKKNHICVAICFMTGAFWYSVLPARLLRIPVVLAERNGPSIYYKTRIRKIRWIVFLSMNLSNVITVQFDSFVKKYPIYLRKKVRVISNEIPILDNISQSKSKNLRYLFAGRFTNQKQVRELIYAFVKFHQEYPNSELTLFGEGELHKEIQLYLERGQFKNFIKIKSPTTLIASAFNDSDVLIAPSLWEGFPNIVAESLASGLPVGGFNDCEGVRDLVVNGNNGWLIERTHPIQSLVLLLKIIYADQNKLSYLSINAKASVIKFQTNESYKKWNKLIYNLAKK